MHKEKTSTEKASFSLLVFYLFLCLSEAALVLLYAGVQESALGTICAKIALPFMIALTLLPFMPLSLAWNIIALRRAEGSQRKARLTQTILTPVFYILIWTVTCVLFVTVTGGV